MQYNELLQYRIEQLHASPSLINDLRFNTFVFTNLCLEIILMIICAAEVNR